MLLNISTPNKCSYKFKNTYAQKQSWIFWLWAIIWKPLHHEQKTSENAKLYSLPKYITTLLAYNYLWSCWKLKLQSKHKNFLFAHNSGSFNTQSCSLFLHSVASTFELVLPQRVYVAHLKLFLMPFRRQILLTQFTFLVKTNLFLSTYPKILSMCNSINYTNAPPHELFRPDVSNLPKGARNPPASNCFRVSSGGQFVN